MTCHVCKAQIASGSRFCSICGSSTEPVAVTVSGGAARSESLLAEANLFRLRAQWTEAEKRCVDAMRIDSNNVHAQALLGDIYRDQGKAEEAKQWYQMALDLDPDNRALQTKLREAARSRPPRPPASPDTGPRKSISASLGTQNLMGLSPTHWFRVIWVFCGLFVVAVVGLVLWMKSHPQTVSYMPLGTIPGTVPDAVRLLPNGTPRTPDNSAPGQPTGTAPQPAPSLNNGLVTPGRNGSPNPAGSGLSDLAAKEQALNAQFSRPGALPNDVTGAAAKVDPRGQKVTLSLVQRAIAGGIESDQHAAVARAALMAAQLIFATDAGYQSVSVNCRLAGQDAMARPYFEADIDRAVAQRIDPSLRDEDRFANPWWAPAPAPEAANHP